MSLFGIIPQDILQTQVYTFLDLKEIMIVDESLCDVMRAHFQESLKGYSLFPYYTFDNNVVLEWVILRQIKLDKYICFQNINNMTIKLLRQIPICFHLTLKGDAEPFIRLSAVHSHSNLMKSLDTSECRHVHNDLVLSLIEDGSYLEELNIEYCNIRESTLISLAQWSPLLKILNISGLKVSDTGLIAISKGCPHLMELRLSQCDSITNASIVSIALHSKKLRCIDLCHCQNITEDAVIALATNCRGLEEIYLSHTSLTDIGLLAVAQGCPDMKTIKMIGGNVTHDALVFAFRHWKYLMEVTIILSRIVIEDTVRILVQSCASLQSINLNFTRDITDGAVIAIADHCSSLTCLQLLYCDLITDTCILYLLRKCKALKKLAFGGDNLTEVSLNYVVEYCPQLSELDLTTFGKYLPLGPILSIARSCKSLKTLTVGLVSELRPGMPLRNAFLAIRPDVQIIGS